MLSAERRINRREALLTAGLVGVGAVAALMPACGAAAAGTASSGPESSRGLEGTWLQKISPDDGQSGHQILALYTKDGGAVETPTLAASDFSSGYGAWIRSGDKYLITFELFAFNPSGQPTGVLRVRSLATIDQKGDQINGQSKLEFQPVGHAGFDFSGTAHFTGTRIQALPM